MQREIFETHYQEYCRQISVLDFAAIQETLRVKHTGEGVIIPFLGKEYVVSPQGIADGLGDRPEYMVCVILAKYLLLCPGTPVENSAWAALKDFHKRSQLTNINVFTSDAEQAIVKRFSGRLAPLRDAAQQLGGVPCETGSPYDLSVEFTVLPKISILLLFNDRDDEFPATCSMLFHRHAEEYLDPESLILTGITLAQRLLSLSPA